MFAIVDFDPFDAGDKAWDDYFSFYNTIAKTSISSGEYKFWLKESLKGKQKKFKLLYNEDKLVLVVTSFTKKDNSHNEMLFINLDTILAEQSIVLLTTTANAILQLLNGGHFRSFRITTVNPSIIEMMGCFNGQMVNKLNFYQLSRNNLNGELLNAWQKNKYIETGELKLMIYEYVPENIYSEYAALLTTLMNGIVRADTREYFEETVERVKHKMELFKKNGVKMLLLMLSDLDDLLVGISIMLVYPDSTIANQEMTGVIAQYRNKKIAAFLKAAMTEEAFHRFPWIDTIETNCYEANKAIIHLNETFGFTPKETQLQFEVDAEQVAKFSGANL